ncbi:FecR family protein [Geofilum sp. OHC36d9]|uniref:FecR family protein n=1 Tax=Geofilum sp. OHC36d9 TaxID=3458413 RepID=UPI004034D86D
MKAEQPYNETLIVRYLCGEADEAEVGQVKSLLVSDSHFRDFFEQTRFVWEQSARPNYNINHDWEVIRRRIGFETPTVSLWHYFTRIAAVLAVVLSVSAGLWVYWNVPGYGRWVVFETGALSDSLVLPDASVVFLNRNSSLKYPSVFSDEQRRVALEGEGFFEVTPDKRRPFKIKAGDVDVRVVGTAFNLDATRADGVVELNVTHGTVLIKNRENEILVNKGEWALASREVVGKGLITNNNFLSWKTGMLEFNNATLKEISSALNHHFAEIKKVEIDTESNVLVTTRFDGQNLAEILDELSVHFQKKFLLDHGTLVISE